MRKEPDETFEQAIATHDELVRRHGMAIWVGGEPTFTNRHSLTPEWLADALGSDKEARARGMLAELAQSQGGIILRTLGRQYPGEKRPRWNLGLYRWRDGRSCWSGPPDPVLLGKSGHGCRAHTLEAFWIELERRLQARGWAAACFQVEGGQLRIACRCDGQPPVSNPGREPRLNRLSIHSQAIPLTGLCDELAETGCFLVLIGISETAGSSPVPLLEMPAFPDVDTFSGFLQEVGQAASAAALESLILTGFPPPVDTSVSWTTLTPDPGVVEVNMAPAADVTTLLAWNRQLFAAAARQGLSPLRYHYNGQITDSGGGGQLTLGGPSPETSPFFIKPRLLPALVRYCNRHPSLSYYFASDFIGSSSQSPRPDEGTRTSFAELNLTLELLARQENPAPETLWSSLAPFLADPAGNTHRSELNIEKLWNPYLPSRGRLGLVEFRAFRMAATPEHSAALAALLRAIALLLSSREKRGAALKDWGNELHDRFALPYFLRCDLREILAELAEAGLGLGQPLVDQLLDDSYHLLGQVEFQGFHLTLKRALEFWPLLGDVASQERGTSRLVDAGTSRIEITLRPLPGSPAAPNGWQLQVDGYQVPLRREEDEEGAVFVWGLRYRNFVPSRGLHPGLAAHGPVTLTLFQPAGPAALRVTLHNWEPHGRPYNGLPADADEACRRRAERCIIEYLDSAVKEDFGPPPAGALSPYCLDLRGL
jgi:uncharacterized protein (DUF2126 family)